MRIIDPRTGKSYVSKRRRRYDEVRAPHELTFSCFHHFPFLSRDRTRQWFVDALKAVRPKWPIDLWAWVIMPEHVHILVAPREDGVKIGRFAGSIKEIVARRGIAWMAKNAPEWLPRITVIEGTKSRRRFWQAGGGYDRTVEEIATLRSMIDYIHANPVRRGLVERAEDWEWSSARWYAGILPVHLEMDRTLPDM